jgi:hypothetical protein
MKKFTLLFTVLFAAFVINAQNVAINNDGSSAEASAMLDVKSTTKGFMMPRVTSAQRTSITSPALGLLVFDTETKTIWVYDGSSWKNLYTSGGGLTLPFSQTVNTATSAFQITNQGTGAAIEGSSSAQFGIGMTAKTTGEGGWGLFAFSNGAGSQSIRSYADNGTAFHGENNNPANTNTLMNLLNKGAGKTGSFQLANNSSTSPNVQIAGNHLGEQLKIYQTNAANTSAAVSIENSGTGTGIEATSTTGYGVKGVTNTATGFAGVFGQNTGTAGSGVVGSSHAPNTQGVYGSSQNGIAVRALGDNYRAVQATSNGGTALYGSSTTGYALEINGKVKIAGGNTNPSAGAVLTSDAQGNATWQQQPAATPKIAFKAAGIADAIGFTNSIASSAFFEPNHSKVEFKSLGYDFGNGYTLFNGTETGTTSTYSVPVRGLYHFDASLVFVSAITFDYTDIEISIMLVRDGATSVLLRKGAYISSVENKSAAVSGDVTLLAGDKIYVAIRQYNIASLPSLLEDTYDQCFFSGHLVFSF